jgi:RHS repeat-associated protein
MWGGRTLTKDPGTGLEYRRLNTTNARGQATQETFGNGVTLTPTYQGQTGQLTGLTYSKTGTLRQLGYGYDVFGNLKRQSLNGNASREDYSYDQLHRLVQSIRSGAASGTVSYGYDAVGNLSKKSDFSSNTANAYQYTGGSCGGGANAVKSVALNAGGSRTYCYDANGNLTGDNAGLSIAYDHQNLPTKATRGAQTDWFRYGADGMRTRSWGADGSRVYLPGYEHRTDTGETKVYVGDYAVISRTGSTRKVEYLLKDRLGSVDAVANATGAVIETRGYDAFGKPRDGSWNDLNPAKIASTAVTPKGFTQHEHLNQLELIHMNGRAYDYHLGRFTGVDPFIQFPLNSQSLNPYSYILNNPLSGTDPTGYAFRDILNGQSEVGRFNGPPKRDDDDEKPQETPDTDGVTSTGKPEGNGASNQQTSTGSDERGQERESLGDANQNGAATANQDGSEKQENGKSEPTMPPGVDINTTIPNRVDIVARDKRGNPTFIGSRDVVTNSSVGGDNANATDMRQGTLILVNGERIPAQVPVNSKVFARTMNCHGFSIGQGTAEISPEAMTEFLKRTRLLERVAAPQVGDLAVWRGRDGLAVHSAIVSGEGAVTMAIGSVVFEIPNGVGQSKVTNVTTDSAWVGQPEYWRQVK